MCIGNQVQKNLQQILTHGGWERCSTVHIVDLCSENISKSSSDVEFFIFKKKKCHI